MADKSGENGIFLEFQNFIVRVWLRLFITYVDTIKMKGISHCLKI